MSKNDHFWTSKNVTEQTVKPVHRQPYFPCPFRYKFCYKITIHFFNVQSISQSDTEDTKLEEGNSKENYLISIQQEAEKAKAEAKKFEEESNNFRSELQKAQDLIKHLEREKREITEEVKKSESKLLPSSSEKQELSKKGKEVINLLFKCPY